MLNRAHALQDQITAWRRDFHMHPELSFQEVRTAQKVSAALQELGLEVQTGVARTGVVARLGEGSPVVAIRADMDALPIHEANDIPYASLNPGVMHACGHDAHTAILLGVARLLSETPDLPPGEVRFLFQPSEEDWDDDDKSGGKLMVEEGILDGVQAVIALHVYSLGRSGKVQVQAGYDSAAVDSFEVVITGQGGHGAYPHRTVDPIFILAQVINAVNGIRARRVNPVRPAVISIGAVHAGTASNVIPDKVELEGTIRSYDEQTRQQLWVELDRALSVARALGGDYTLKIRKGYPAVYNDPSVVELIRTVTTEIVGPDALDEPEPGMGAEDFSYMTQIAPGAMFVLGACLDATDRPHHSPIFDLDETALPVGAAVLAETAIRLLRRYGDKGKATG